MLRSTFSFALLLVLSCGDGTPAPPAPGARLVAVGPLTHVLTYGARAPLRVRYEQADGSPIASATIDWSIQGVSGSSTITARASDTDGGGGTGVEVDAASEDVSFQVVATPPLGDPLVFHVAVTAEAAGSISARLVWAGPGDVPFDRYSAFLFQDATCASLDPARLPTALIAAAPVTSIAARPGFLPVPAGSGYTVAVVAEIAGARAGFGCTPNVTVAAGAESSVDVLVSSFTGAIRVEGIYELDNQLDFSGSLPPSIDTAITLLDELTDDQDVNGSGPTMDFGQDPGAFLVDFAMRQTCAWECLSGEDASTCSEVNHGLGDISAIYLESFRTWSGAQARFFGGCGAWEDAHIPAQNLVNAQIDAVVPDSITMWSVIAGDLARAIDQAHFASRLTVDPPQVGGSSFIHEMLDMTVVIHRLDGSESTFTFDVLDAGLASRPRGEARLTVTGDTVLIGSHGFDVDFGLIVRYVYLEGILPLLGYASSAAMLEAFIDCDAIGTSLAGSVGGFSAADYTSYCRLGLTGAGTYLDLGLDGFIDQDGVLTLEGICTAADLDAAGRAESLAAGEWTGGWSEGSESGDLTGAFTGAAL